MKILVFTDLHIHDYKQFNSDHNRLDNCLKVLHDVADRAHHDGINTILFVGDLFDSQRALLTRVVNRTVETFVHLFEKYPDIRWYAITGNHDQAEKSLYKGVGTTPAESALKHIETLSDGQFYIVDSSIIEIGNVLVGGIPYYEYPEHFEQALLDLTEAIDIHYETPEEFYKILLIHQTPVDPTGNPMIKTETNPSDPVYSKWDYTFCGHIHSRKQLTDNFLIVGSPIHRDLGDEGQTKGYIIFDTDTSTYEFTHLQDYPEYKQVFQKDYTPTENEFDFVVVKPDPESLRIDTATVEKFSVDLTQESLVTNYWKEAEGENEEILKAGLACIQIT